MSNVWPKQCANCKRTYDPDAWEKCDYGGVQKGDFMGLGYPDHETRTCRCGTPMVVNCPTDIHLK